MDQIARGSDTHRVGFAIPLRVRQNVGSVFALDDARIFNAAGPLARLLLVLGGIKHRLVAAREVNAVVALSQPKARGVAANLHGAGIVLRAIKNEDLAVAHNGRGIEGMQRFPVNGCFRKADP